MGEAGGLTVVRFFFIVHAMNETDTIPNLNVKRRRNPGLNLPSTVPGQHLGQRNMSAEEWQENQDHLQQQHTKGWIENREREIKERKELERAVRQLPPSQYGNDILDEAHNVKPIPKAPVKALKGRGPKTDPTGRVVSEGDVPVKRQRTKKGSRVAEARKNARLSKVLA